jgi:hypothetical protein
MEAIDANSVESTAEEQDQAAAEQQDVQTDFASRVIVSAAITVGALAIAITHAAFPAIVIDTITLGLVIGAALPWAAPFVKSFKAPGGLEIELRDLKKRVGQTEQRVGQAEHRVGQTEQRVQEVGDGVEGLGWRADAARDVVLASVVSSAPPPVAAPPMTAQDVPAVAGARMAGEVAPGAPSAADERLSRLIDKYDKVREGQDVGDARTSHMTSIVSEMIRLAPHLTGFNVAEALASRDGGLRLAAYACLYASPNLDLLDPLVAAMLGDGTGFGQFWGLQAISRAVALLDLSDTDTRDRVADKLQALKSELERERRGGDRRYELKRILRLLGRN